MSWPLFIIDQPGENDSYWDLPTGACWFGDPRYANVGDDYKANWEWRRNPIWVKLPSRDIFCVDGRSYNGTDFGPGWRVSGTLPLITVTPSIHYPDYYHGFITNGILTDDIEGRVF